MIKHVLEKKSRTCACSLSVHVNTVIFIHIYLIADQFELPGEVWFDLLFPLTDGPEQCKCDNV